MIYQGHLFDKSIMVERTMSNGSIVRLKLVPLEDQHVKILEYHRKPVKQTAFKRLSQEEGRVVVFDDLNLDYPFSTLFE